MIAPNNSQLSETPIEKYTFHVDGEKSLDSVMTLNATMTSNQVDLTNTTTNASINTIGTTVGSNGILTIDNHTPTWICPSYPSHLPYGTVQVTQAENGFIVEHNYKKYIAMNAAGLNKILTKLLPAKETKKKKS